MAIVRCADLEERKTLAASGRVKVATRTRGVISIKPDNLERLTPEFDPRLESTITDDVHQGEMPVPVSRDVIENCLQTREEVPMVRCHRCATTDSDTYCCLATSTKGAVKFECMACLVFEAAEAGVRAEWVTDFIDDRYLGSVQACSMMQGLDGCGGMGATYGAPRPVPARAPQPARPGCEQEGW